MTDEMKFIRNELEKDIIKKLDAIREKLTSHTDTNIVRHLQMLSMVNDDLDDVILNFEPNILDSGFDDDTM